MNSPRFRLLPALAAVLLAGAVLAPSGAGAQGSTASEGSPPEASTSAASIDGLLSIDNGNGFTCGSDTFGKVFCWGTNNRGQLGSGVAIQALIPKAVTTAGTPLDGQKVQQVSLGSSFACGLTTSSGIACWGANDRGQLGDGSTDDSQVPVAVSVAGTPLDGKSIDHISTGTSHACALTTTNIMACWGTNSTGQLGNGANVDSGAPVAVTTVGTPLAGKTIRQVVAGGFNTCAVTTDGVVACWGAGSKGALGTASTASSNVPVSPTLVGTALAGKTINLLSVARYSVCVTTTDGKLVCWGNNASGQLGLNSTTEQPTAVEVPLAGTPLDGKTIEGIEAGLDHFCADVAGSGPACWGNDVRGAIGDGNSDPTNVLVPTAVVTAGTPLAGATVKAISAGQHMSCALHSGGEAACWGNGLFGGLGNGIRADSDLPVATALSTTLPSSPSITGVIAQAGGVKVTWTAPTSTGGLPIFRYQVTTYIGANAVGFINSGQLDRVISGLDPDVTYRFTVKAENLVGLGPESPFSASISPLPPGDPYVAITPCRIVDTRQSGGRFADREIRDYTVTGSGPAFAAQGGKSGGCAIPDGATAVEASITAVGPATSGFFRAWPSGQSMPNATFMNFDTGMDITNTGSITLASSAPAAATNDGGPAHMRARNFGGASHYVIDIQGYFQDGPGGAGGATTAAVSDPSDYVAITPCRIVDTREAGGPLINREIRDITVTGSGGRFAAQGGTANGCAIPDGAVAVEASITAVGPATSGFFRAWPSGQSMPNATFMNFDTGMDITNTGSVTIAQDLPPGAEATTSAVGDHLRIRNFGGTSQYVIDIQGYYQPSDLGDGAAAASAVGPTARYVAITPCRIVDTREAGGPLINREIRDITVTGGGGRFAAQGGTADGCGIPQGAVAVEASITAVGPATSGFFRAWPSGESMPNATFMNFDTGMDITNTGSVTIAQDLPPGAEATTSAVGDHLRIRNFGGTSQYVIDIQGYFTSTRPS